MDTVFPQLRGGAEDVTYRWEERKTDACAVQALTFPALTALGVAEHAFSTRLGGVSRGPYASMNLGLSRRDDPAAVRENYRRMAAFLGRTPEDIVLSYQTHTATVRVVTAADKGKGIVRERDYRDVDAFVTDVPGVVLVTLHADCTPLYFVDPVRRAVGLAHSGWRGTVGRIGAAVAETMHREYGTEPSDLIAVIGPTICGRCYEVGGEVAAEFFAAFGKERCLWAGIVTEPDKQDGEEAAAQNAVLDAGAEAGEAVRDAGAGADGAACRDQTVHNKYHVSLPRANELLLADAGLLPEHIHDCGLCTFENSGFLFSHRAVRGGERGNLGAFLSLRPAS